MDPRGGPRPSPYSILTLDASTSNPVRPSQRLSPEAGGYIETITRGALKPSTNYASGTAQQFAGSSQQYAPSKATSAGFEFQKYKKNVDSYDIHDRDPPPYDEHDLHEIHPAEARPKVGHAVVELHEAGPFTDEHQPEAIQTMVKMVTMLNFMKVELGDHKTLRSKEQWRAAAAEFIGTMLFVYLGCGSVIASGMISRDMTCARLVVIAVAHGLAICCLAAATGAISGGHLNPAVTLAFVVAGKETLIRAGLYIGAQRGLGSHDIDKNVFDSQGLLMEIVLTFMLIFVVFGVAVDRRGPGVIAPIPIGFAVLVDHLVGVPYTGASMNPARSFGPALVSGHWGRSHIIYWFGPCFGASLASAIYRLGFLEPSLAKPLEASKIGKAPERAMQ
ncbi:aquaporin TIP4-4 isoform X2 [Physcomitrium patens]|uniref:aquaporin TIP4-4 isoform X2 n=1 Tax=Physcomitrium patens TaxID=3218 RepID=UPI000D15E4D6|nr:aquaporin TIP4-4-like isoform X2 [Physcomitrium patens]|eukprot:XP_024382300.1 aquaporin TIP4-4-like isoform X2 [Physcomitrella patens]